jgi:site-specific DNA-methyltransferase (adenine-specific)
MTNMLYFGDNLDILSRLRSGSVDLIYLDPPFNSQEEYNLLFDTPNREGRSAQAGAFLDTWTWGDEAELSYKNVMQSGGNLARLVGALRSALRDSDMMAYLVMMAARLRELHDKLKDDGSLYLHCDPTASHYLKLLLDQIFGPVMFRNEIVWKRTSAHSAAVRWNDVHDCLLFYTKSERYCWNTIFTPYDERYRARFKNVDPDGRRWYSDNLTAPGIRHGFSGMEWHGHNPTRDGNHWKINNEAVIELVGKQETERLNTIEKLDLLDSHGLLYWTSGDGYPRFKRVLGAGLAPQDIISDIPPLNSQAQERWGYPTQKPLALLSRLLAVSSEPGDVVLDPFCGCGTTIEAAELSGRQWIGIDIAVHAIKIIEARLKRLPSCQQYSVEGMPRDFESAARLAERDKYQFQWWANYLFNPHAIREQKKGPDRGIDGELFFPNGPGRSWGRMLTSVKGGETLNPDMIRAFAQVLAREKAEMGLFICLYQPTRGMEREASAVGIADTAHGDLPRLQIVSIEEWFRGRMPLLPPLEHLPSAAISRVGRRRRQAAPRPDITQPEFPLPLSGGQSANVVRHFNRQMIDEGDEVLAIAKRSTAR